MTGWQVQAWVLMGNHYHLFIRTPEANLVAGMSWLQNTYTRRYNVRHRAWGRVFGDRYKAVVVEGEDPYHYQTLMDYLHLNPVRARLIQPAKSDGPAQSILDYPWSSLASAYAVPSKQRPKWLDAESGFRAFQLPDTAAGRRQMVARLDKRAVTEAMKACGVPAMPEEVDARCSHLRRGWYWGRQAFAEKLQKQLQTLLKQKTPKSRSYQNTSQHHEHSIAAAEKWLSAGLKAAGLKAKDLAELKGSDPRKLALAHWLWKHTTVSQEWLAEKLHMRSAANVSQQLRRLDMQLILPKLPANLQEWLHQSNDSRV